METAVKAGSGVSATGISAPAVPPERARMPDPYDALADLFLGEVTQAGPSGSSPKRDGAPEPAPDAGARPSAPVFRSGAEVASSPNLRTRGVVGVIGRGVRRTERTTPVPVEPAPPSKDKAPHAAASGPSISPAHPDMIGFVPTRAARAQPRPPARAGAADAARSVVPAADVCVEGLVLGHLPVLGSVWGSQYARHVAASEGRVVAMLRVHRGVCTVELIGEGARQAGGAISGGAGLELGGLLRELAAQTTRWMVRFDELDEPELASCEGIDALTLLSGTDEMAMASAFRTIKKLDRTGVRGEEGEVALTPRAAPGLRLAVMGSPREQAERAARKLIDAAEAYTGHEVSLAACIEKIQSGAAGVPALRASVQMGPQAILGELRRSLDAARRADEADPAVEATVEPESEGPEHELSGATQAEVTPESPAGESAASTARGQATRQSELETTLVLAANVPGLRPIAARCPYAPAVGLALDSRGGVHLLASVPEPDAEHSVVRSMLTGDDWLKDHLELVRLTLPPGMPLDATRPVVQHIFITQGSAVRRLLRQGMRVHLAMPGTDDWMLGVARYVEVS